MNVAAGPTGDGETISEQMSRIIAASVAARERSAGQAVDLAQRRRNMRAGAERMPQPPGVVVEPVEADGVPCEWIRPADVTDERVVMFLHGGGYANGGLDTHRKMIGFLAASSGLAVLSVGYRLAPEHPFPAALDDSGRALSWLVANVVAAEDVVVAGDSAGGGLALATCLTARQCGLAMPGAVVLLSPWVDMAPPSVSGDDKIDDPLVTQVSLDELRDLYLSGAEPTDPLVSPVYGDLQGLPPTLIQVGERELLRDGAQRLHGALVAQGVDARCDVWPGMVHVWHFYAGLAPEADAALAAVGEWLHDQRATAAS